MPRYPLFFTGDEACTEVAKPDGLWNWCLLGPDPEKLPLSAGGSGGIEEIKEVLGAHPMSFGLLRMTFGIRSASEQGGAARGRETCATRWLFLHVSDAEAGVHSGVARGQASAKLPEMEKVLGRYVKTAAKAQITSKDECNVEFLLPIVQKVAKFEAHLFTIEKYNMAMEDFQERHPPNEEVEQEEQLAIQQVEEEAPPVEEVEPVPEDAKLDEEEELFKQRKAMKLFKMGDAVLVFSNQGQMWHDDGIIVEALDEAGQRDGSRLPAGSMKAQYNSGRRYKWVTPQQAKSFLQPSSRPIPPPTLAGELYKETHNWITEWHVRHFVLRQGFLQWWMSAEDAQNGVTPNGVVSLLGLQIKLMQTVFSMRTASTKGVIYSFDATTDEGVSKWVESLNKHSEYCEKMRQHMYASANQLREGNGSAEAPPDLAPSAPDLAPSAPVSPDAAGSGEKRPGQDDDDGLPDCAVRAGA